MARGRDSIGRFSGQPLASGPIVIRTLFRPRSSARPPLLRELKSVLPEGGLIAPSRRVTTYERDGLPCAGGEPLAIALPATTEQVSQIVAIARAAGVRVMPRGAGTSRCGAAIPLEHSLVISTARMKSVVAFDAQGGRIRVQPGVTNRAISEHVRAAGWFYAPDPSSRRTCTIGGNIATNSSGACALRHGVTADHLLGATAVLHDGAIVELGEHARRQSGYDLSGFLCGSEGQLALVAEATLRLEPVAEHSETVIAGFAARADALAAASAVLRAGVLPYRLEFMDWRAVAFTEALVASGYPRDAQGVLLVELQGLHADVAEDARLLSELLHGAGATSLACSPTDAELDPWAGREAIYRAVSGVGGFEALDCCVPRTQLDAALAQVEAIAAQHGMDHATVAHAGDGTLHTFVLYKTADHASADRARACADRIRSACVALDGTVSAEYGIGLGRRELLTLQFSALDLLQQRRAREAFAPGDWLNPGKVFPQ